MTQTITAASLSLFNPSDAYISNDPFETYVLYDVSTPIDELRAGGSSKTAIYMDLASGIALGSVNATPAANGQNVVIRLNSAGLSYLNARRGNQVALGGALSEVGSSGTAEQLFALTNTPNSASRVLTLTTQPDGTWLNSTNIDNNWSTAGNWANALVPSSSLDAIFNSNTGHSVDFTKDASVNSLQVQDDNVSLQLAGKTLSIAGDVILSELGGGTLRLSDGIVYQLRPSPQLVVGQQTSGSLIVENGAIFYTNAATHVGQRSGTTGALNVTGSGSRMVASGATFAVADGGNGALNVTAGGALTVNNSITVAQSGGNGTITVNGTDSVLTCFGSIYLGGNTINLGAGNGTLNIEGGLVDAGSVVVYNSGTSAVKLSGGTLITGSLDLRGNASRLNWTGGRLQLYGGGTSNVGSLVVPAGGTLAANGTITGNVTNGGTIAPRNDSIPLKITGNLTSTGTLAFDLYSATDRSKISVGGVANLSGGIELHINSGFTWPSYTIPLLSASSYVGSISTITGDRRLGDGRYVTVSLTTTSGLELRLFDAGDATLDGKVNFDDLVPLAQNYNRPGLKWEDGDFTGDGLVNFDDLVSLAQHYNTSRPPTLLAANAAFTADWALAQSLVPEPTSLAAIALGGSLLRRRRRA